MNNSDPDNASNTDNINTQKNVSIYDGTWMGNFNYEYQDYFFDSNNKEVAGDWNPGEIDVTIEFHTKNIYQYGDNPDDLAVWLDATNIVVSNDPAFETGMEGVNPTGVFGDEISLGLPLDPKNPILDGNYVPLQFLFPNGAYILGMKCNSLKFNEKGTVMYSLTCPKTPDITWEGWARTGNLQGTVGVDYRRYKFNSWTLTQIFSDYSN